MKTSNKILWTGAAAFVLLLAVSVSKQMHRYREANPYAEELHHALGSGRIRVVAIEGEFSPHILEKTGRRSGSLYMSQTPNSENARIAHDTLYLSGTAIGGMDISGAVYLHNGTPLPLPNDTANSSGIVKTPIPYPID